MIKRALFSVHDKTGLTPLATELQSQGWSIDSSGGTAEHLQQAGINVITVEEVTGFPAILGGRVKTLHPMIHGGILGQLDKQSDLDDLLRHGIKPYGLVGVNLYPFEKTIRQPGVTEEDAIENIDIGGVALIRAAAKNYRHVAVVTNIDQYSRIISDLQQHGEITLALRKQLASEAYQYTAWYDTAIMNWMAQQEGVEVPLFPEKLILPYQLVQKLRYGENPHQQGALYRVPGFSIPSVVNATQVWGKVPSATTIGDLNAGVETVREMLNLRNFPHWNLAAVVIKHNTPCGLAVGDSPVETYVKAREADPLSAFGGVIALNFPIDAATAHEICAIKVDGVIAPGFADDQALGVIQAAREKAKTPIFIIPELVPLPTGSMNLKYVVGGLILQQADLEPVKLNDWNVVTEKQVPDGQWKDILFGWLAIMHVRSNSVIVVKDGQTLGIGSGQTSRIGSAKIALQQAGEGAKGAILISDGFCPFNDVVTEAAKCGIATVVQPGGSVNDKASIDAANEHGLAMVFTGRRAFWH
ncbi:MAG: bifunctional phosphoribosylaminoimidazolecarboxamide formyltransferase/inosine monophosphate cyclohydrolase [Candidatus Kerfeldbacteria bacterium CG_4_10_14_0_8_um_filter_42_10]|uniref:Bifunctional purine biosynthesis protein PurH n=1 Tax=Candidatus Kerfeldbacteria bacterium CG_4_10_14_0_8_um_filter_42_10 TaxID=2014248 RepID=A0A2M7RL55_9BACT|nr:MAG: bifunctional phosphoribosylaminoimidazolecarboxamide formyltransferase/inosine monophosphate cyclohydrolase [Candidatus Kerfeldbacteria bacterium CG_4_10_14_0_8_um_filter_42_10]